MSGGMVLVDVSGKAEVVLTSKGDLATWDTARVRKGVSATNYTGLQADSAIADGLTYGATARSTLTGTGSILYSSGANTLSQLSAGTGEYTLKMNSGATAPEWVNVSAGGATTTRVQATITSSFTTTSGSFVDITGISIVIPSITSGKAIIVCTLNTNRDGNGGTQYILDDDGSHITHTEKAYEFTSSSSRPVITLCEVMDSNGSTVNCQCYTGGNTLTIYGAAADFTSDINCIAVG